MSVGLSKAPTNTSRQAVHDSPLLSKKMRRTHNFMPYLNPLIDMDESGPDDYKKKSAFPGTGSCISMAASRFKKVRGS